MTAEILARRDRIRGKLNAAIGMAEMDGGQRFRLRLALIRPDVRDAVEEYIDSLADTQAIGDGELIKLILDHLPEIIELIKLIVGLF